MKKSTQDLYTHLLVLFTVLIAGYLGYLADPVFFSTIWQLIAGADVASATEFLRSLGPAAFTVSFLIIVFINAVGVLPNFLFLAANGVIFGVAAGTTISWAGEIVGSLIGFVFLRYMFRDYASHLVEKCGAAHHTAELGSKRGFQLILIARAIPYMPSGLVTALSAVSSVSLWDYTLATAIGKLPSVWLEVTLGHDVVSYKEHLLRLTLLIIISVAAFVFVWWFRRRQRCRT